MYKTRRSFLVYPFAFLLSVVLAVCLLILASLFPQDKIDENVLASAYQMIEEDKFVADHSYGSIMSRSSEVLMFMESKAMSISDPETIFSNPTFAYVGSTHGSYDLLSYAQGEEPNSVSPYSRYWMGFRVTLRLLLQKLDFYQIRRYTAVSFFLLLFAAICSLSHNLDSKLAFLFSLSIITVRPHIIAISLQSFTCFAIAFIGMLLVPWMYRHPRWLTLFLWSLALQRCFLISTPFLLLRLDSQ